MVSAEPWCGRTTSLSITCHRANWEAHIILIKDHRLKNKHNCVTHHRSFPPTSKIMVTHFHLLFAKNIYYMHRQMSLTQNYGAYSICIFHA